MKNSKIHQKITKERYRLRAMEAPSINYDGHSRRDRINILEMFPVLQAKFVWDEIPTPLFLQTLSRMQHHTEVTYFTKEKQAEKLTEMKTVFAIDAPSGPVELVCKIEHYARHHILKLSWDENPGEHLEVFDELFAKTNPEATDELIERYVIYFKEETDVEMILSEVFFMEAERRMAEKLSELFQVTSLAVENQSEKELVYHSQLKLLKQDATIQMKTKMLDNDGYLINTWYVIGEDSKKEKNDEFIQDYCCENGITLSYLGLGWQSHNVVDYQDRAFLSFLSKEYTKTKEYQLRKKFKPETVRAVEVGENLYFE